VRQDNDLEGLDRADSAIQMICPALRRAAIEYLWDRYVVHGSTAPKQDGVCRHSEPTIADERLMRSEE
jgi:hypothetical protein